MIFNNSLNFINKLFIFFKKKSRSIYLNSNIYNKKISSSVNSPLEYQPSPDLLDCLVKYNKKKINIKNYFLDEELEKDISAFGVVEIDLRDFTNEKIYQKWKDQGGLDYWTGLPLDFEDAVGDHLIPRSEGKALGGVTEYHNLVVTSDVNNRIKSNMNPESFKKQVA